MEAPSRLTLGGATTLQAKMQIAGIRVAKSTKPAEMKTAQHDCPNLYQQTRKPTKKGAKFAPFVKYHEDEQN
jgi:hypothetical protein